MKKLILITSLLLGSKIVHAQTLTFKAGPSVSKMSIDVDYYSLDLYKLHYGYTVSTGIDFLEKKHFNLSANVSYMNVGGNGIYAKQYDWSGGFIKSNYTVSLNYLTLGAKAFFKYPFKENKILFIGLGPRLDFLNSLRENTVWFKPFKDDHEMEPLNYILSLELGYGANINEKWSYKISGEFNLNQPVVLNKKYEYAYSNQKSTLTFCSIFSFSMGYKL